jgi:hypothetical protein
MMYSYYRSKIKAPDLCLQHKSGAGIQIRIWALLSGGFTLALTENDLPHMPKIRYSFFFVRAFPLPPAAVSTSDKCLFR